MTISTVVHPTMNASYVRFSDHTLNMNLSRRLLCWGLGIPAHELINIWPRNSASEELDAVELQIPQVATISMKKLRYIAAC